MFSSKLDDIQQNTQRLTSRTTYRENTDQLQEIKYAESNLTESRSQTPVQQRNEQAAPGVSSL